jgi:hypothetical protein
MLDYITSIVSGAKVTSICTIRLNKVSLALEVFADEVRIGLQNWLACLFSAWHPALSDFITAAIACFQAAVRKAIV